MINGKNLAELINKAKLAASNSYSPYSKFKVGSAILLSDGEIFSGCNIENASYGLTNCAERTAIYKAISEYKDKPQIIAVAVYTPTSDLTFPCGPCRQVIYEFGQDANIVSVCDEPNKKSILKIKDLLPKAFGPESL